MTKRKKETVSQRPGTRRAKKPKPCQRVTPVTAQDQLQSTVLQHAHDYAALGLEVVLLHGAVENGGKLQCTCRRGAKCPCPGKHPRQKNWQRKGTTYPATIRKRFERWPDSNVGILTGPGSDLIVVDVDAHKFGDEGLEQLETKYGKLPETVECLTGGGGRHLYFRYPSVPSGREVGNSVNLDGVGGVDIRGLGGQVVAPPSIHASGKEYVWEIEHDLLDGGTLADLPPEWLRRLSRQIQTNDSGPPAVDTDGKTGATPCGKAGVPSEDTLDFIAHGAPESTRNDRLFKAAADLNGCGYPREGAAGLLKPAAVKCGLGVQEVMRTIESAYSQPRNPSRRQGTPREPDPKLRESGKTSQLLSVPATGDLPFTIECRPLDNKGKVTLTIRDGDDVRHVDTLDITKASAREKVVAAIADEQEATAKEAVSQALTRLAADVAKAPTPERVPTEAEELLDAMPDGVKAAARKMLADPDLMVCILADIRAIGVTGEENLAKAVYLGGTSRLLGTPLAEIVQGPTSSGKSYIIQKTAKLFPPEAVILAHKMTPEALVHMPYGSLQHKWVVAGERSRRQDDKAADATRALREMISDGHLSKLMPVKGPDGKIETVQIQQPGPIAYVESTTQDGILDEDRNRCIVLHTDESPEQTARILTFMAERKQRAGEDNESYEVIQKHIAAQRMLQGVRVVIPFAGRLAESFPHQRTDARRSFGHLLSLIEAVALLHQYQRPTEPGAESVILATQEDYEIARGLLAEPMARAQTSGVSPATRRFFDRLVTQVDDTFTSADAARGESVVGDVQTVRKYLKSLADAGFLEVAEAARGNMPAQYRVAADPPSDAELSGLPSMDAVFGVQP